MSMLLEILLHHLALFSMLFPVLYQRLARFAYLKHNGLYAC